MTGEKGSTPAPRRAIRGLEPWFPGYGTCPVESMGRALWITLWITWRLVPLRGMGCRGRAFGDCTMLVMGCVGPESKAGKGSDGGEEAACAS